MRYSANRVQRATIGAFLFATVVATLPVLAQQSPYSHLGRTPSEEELRRWDIAISPDGDELPAGRGTAKEGAAIFARKCAACHGPEGQGTQLAPQIVGGELKVNNGLYVGQPELHVGSAWPFATIIWDYINRAMPWGQGGSLPPDEVYALTAFVLSRNGIIRETDVMDARSLPRVEMPNRDGYVRPPLSEWKPGMQRPFTIE
jgi:cytochrome c